MSIQREKNIRKMSSSFQKSLQSVCINKGHLDPTPNQLFMLFNLDKQAQLPPRPCQAICRMPFACLSRGHACSLAMFEVAASVKQHLQRGPARCSTTYAGKCISCTWAYLPEEAWSKHVLSSAPTCKGTSTEKKKKQSFDDSH